MGCLCRPLPTNWLAHRLENRVSIRRDQKNHRLWKVVNSGTRLYIPETKNVVVQGEPLRSSYVLKIGNGKPGSLKMVSEFPPAGIIGMQLLVSTIFLEIVLGERHDDFVKSYLASSSSGHKSTQIKGLEFLSSFGRDLRCSSRFKIFSMRLIIVYWTLTGFPSVRSP